MGICSSEPEAPPNPVSVDLTHFTLLKVVGKGGFGKVNAIQRRTTNELCALKRMQKCEVIKKESHIRMVWTEREIMARLNSPFLVNLVHAFQDDKELYIVMPFQQGGDLRFHLSKLGCLDEESARFYCAQIILGLEAMHAINVVYRDLKPDNVLLDENGHLRISDFGLSVELKEKNGFKIRGNAGTSGYLAPEVCTGEPYGLSCDVWTLGITAYELIHGRRPFKQWKPTDTIDPCQGLRFGSNVSVACQEFIRGLLVINPSKRLGCGKTSWEEVKSHAWFKDFDWESARNRSGKPPILPDPDAANCNNSADLADQLMDKDPESIPPAEQKHFLNFEFRTDYKEYLAGLERDKNLAGLNMSQATDVGPISSQFTNASHMNSHMFDPPVRVVAADGGSKRSTAVGGTIVVQPNADKTALPDASSSPATEKSAAAAAAEKYVIPEESVNKDVPMPSTESVAAPIVTGESTSSPPKSPLKQPTSARKRDSLNDNFAFTRNAVPPATATAEA